VRVLQLSDKTRADKMVCCSKYTGKARLDGKTAIVTGSNTGIGKYTALDFVKRGKFDSRKLSLTVLRTIATTKEQSFPCHAMKKYRSPHS